MTSATAIRSETSDHPRSRSCKPRPKRFGQPTVFRHIATGWKTRFVADRTGSFEWCFISWVEGAVYVTDSHMTNALIGYAHCSNDTQTVADHRNTLQKLHVAADRIYSRTRPGLWARSRV